MRCTSAKAVLIMTCLVMIGASLALAEMHSPRDYDLPNEYQAYSQTDGGTRGAFAARLIIYVVEPDSRWINNANPSFPNFQYKNACVGHVIDTLLLMGFEENFTASYRWAGEDHGLANIREDNIKVMATILDYSDSLWTDNDDGEFQYYHLSVAGAAALPGVSMPDTADGGYTHTVIVEEPTATWCVHCPKMADALDYIDQNDGLNMHYIALITDVGVPIAYPRSVQLNLCGYPSCFVDGGYRAHCGAANNDPSPYRTTIAASGVRTVPNVDLDLDLAWLGDGAIEVEVSVTCNEFVNAEPDVPGIPSGDADGTINISYEFSTSTSDYESDPIYIRYAWGDGDTTAWLGPYSDEEVCTASHTWTSTGTFTVKAQAKDIYENNESEWSPSASIVMHDYLAGDANGDLQCNILDIVYLINFLYKGGPAPVPYYAADVDDSGVVNIIDITYTIAFLYQGGPAPIYAQ